MIESSYPFTFEYPEVAINSGPGCVSRLSLELQRRGWGRALVVCGKTVGTTSAVVDPVIDGLGDALVDAFAETTPSKDVETALRCVERVRELDIDVLVSLGGGSSLDIAKVASALATTSRSPHDVLSELRAGGRIPPPEGSTELLPHVAIPTTLAGADLSIAGGVTAWKSRNGTEEGVSAGGVSDPRLMPDVLFYDPELFATTPRDVIAASAMNGFDKAIETLYSRHATPITDATASNGVHLLKCSLIRFGDGVRSHETIQDMVNGVILAQYGASRPGQKTLSIIHAFGHGFSRNFDVHQGMVHGIVAPHVLSFLFEQVDGRRGLLADALGIDTTGMDDGAVANDIVQSVVEVRDALGLATRVRSLTGLDESDLPGIANAIVDDPFTRNGPPGLELTSDDVEDVLRRAW